MSWNPPEIKPDLNDELMKRQLLDTLSKCGDNADCLRNACELIIESYVQARVAAKWLGKEAARNLGTIEGPQIPDQ